MLTLWRRYNCVACPLGGPLFAKRTDVLPQDLVKCRCREIACYNDRIVLKFARHFGSPAAEVPSKFQSHWKSLKPISRLRDFARSCGKTSVRLLNRSPGSELGHHCACRCDSATRHQATRRHSADHTSWQDFQSFFWLLMISNAFSIIRFFPKGGIGVGAYRDTYGISLLFALCKGNPLRAINVELVSCVLPRTNCWTNIWGVGDLRRRYYCYC